MRRGWIIVIVLLLVGLPILGYVFFTQIGPKMESAKVFATEATAALADGWTLDAVKKYGTAELAQKIAANEDVALGGYRALGPVAATPACNSTKVSMGSKGTTAQVDCKATFGTSAAKIQLALVEIAGVWKISSFIVSL